MEYEHGYDVAILYFFTYFATMIQKVCDKVLTFFMRKVLQKHDYVKGFRFPYTIKDMEPKLRKELEKDFEGYEDGVVQVGPENIILPAEFRNFAHTLYNLKTRPTDTWVVTFPRSGTTWAQEMVWLVANKADFKNALYYPLFRRFPFLEFSWFQSKKIKDLVLNSTTGTSLNRLFALFTNMDVVEYLKFWLGSRFIKTHLPVQLLPKDILKNGAKVIYIARNPKDVLVSYYHLNQMWRSIRYQNDFDTFFDHFQKNQVYWSPYWSHVKEAWNMRKNPNFLFVFYEEMQRDLEGTIRKVGKFLEKPIKESDIPKMIEHLSIENFRNNKSVNLWQGHQLGYFLKGTEGLFINKGKIGGFKGKYSEQLTKRVDEWIEKNLADTDLKFLE